jgi:hypothetical protein
VAPNAPTKAPRSAWHGPEPPALFVERLLPAADRRRLVNDANVQLRASYDVDWWGKHRSLVAAALGEANARQAEAAQAAQAIAASVAQSYFRLQMLWARQDNVKLLAAVQRELVAGRKARIAHGPGQRELLAARSSTWACWKNSRRAWPPRRCANAKRCAP